MIISIQIQYNIAQEFLNNSMDKFIYSKGLPSIHLKPNFGIESLL